MCRLIGSFNILPLHNSWLFEFLRIGLINSRSRTKIVFKCLTQVLDVMVNFFCKREKLATMTTLADIIF